MRLESMPRYGEHNFKSIDRAMIIFNDVSLRRGKKLLFSGASITLQPGQKIALIGANGSGKSSFFALLLDELSVDGGDIRGLQGLRISHMAQEVEASDLSALQYVLAGDAELYRVLKALEKSDSEENYELSASLHQEMEVLDGYSADRRAERLLLGLGFQHEQLQSGMESFSGGWRIRLNLARALMTPSELLLLDEPTNHLDLDTTIWLQNWLKAYQGTLLMVSHDRDFIDATCDRTIKIENQAVDAYRGGYSDYERQKAERALQQQASFEKQQRRISDIENFVRRFKAKATKARQAQSRIKELERMQIVAPAHIDSPFSFAFPAPGKTSDPLLTLTQTNLGYDAKTILKNVNLSLSPGDRIGLLGKNGAGKSTLLKSLTGELALLQGERTIGAHLRIGYFDQQQLEVLDMEASALLHLQRLSPTAREQSLMDFLGGFNFKGERAKEAIRPFSGGEKARLALAQIVWQDPNVLVLDEPTNHLDLEMRHALELALQHYTGAIILVSHDRHLLRNVVDQLLLVDDGQLAEYDGDIPSYEKWVISSVNSRPALQTPAEQSMVSSSDATQSGLSKKHQRQLTAAAKAKRSPINKEISRIEAAMDRCQRQLTDLQSQLSEEGLYHDEQKHLLQTLIQQEAVLKGEHAALEEQWLTQQAALEAIEDAAD